MDPPPPVSGAFDAAVVEILPATTTDAAEILALQKLAYATEAELHDDWSLPPLIETIDEMRRAIASQVVLKAVAEGRIVGAVRGRLDAGTCCIGRLIAHPAIQGRGLGTRLLRTIEETCAGAERYELFTGHRSEANLRFYQRRGYRIFRRETVNAKVTLVFMEKPASARAAAAAP